MQCGDRRCERQIPLRNWLKTENNFCRHLHLSAINVICHAIILHCHFWMCVSVLNCTNYKNLRKNMKHETCYLLYIFTRGYLIKFVSTGVSYKYVYRYAVSVRGLFFFLNYACIYLKLQFATLIGKKQLTFAIILHNVILTISN